MHVPVNERVRLRAFAVAAFHRARTTPRLGKPGFACAVGLCALLVPATAQSPADNTDRGAAGYSMSRILRLGGYFGLTVLASCPRIMILGGEARDGFFTQ